MTFGDGLILRAGKMKCAVYGVCIYSVTSLKRMYVLCLHTRRQILIEFLNSPELFTVCLHQANTGFDLVKKYIKGFYPQVSLQCKS